jgi:hypothetical protein
MRPKVKNPELPRQKNVGKTSEKELEDIMVSEVSQAQKDKYHLSVEAKVE